MLLANDPNRWPADHFHPGFPTREMVKSAGEYAPPATQPWGEKETQQQPLLPASGTSTDSEGACCFGNGGSKFCLG